MTMQLQTAINNALTFQDLLPIANQLEAKLSFWGRRYVVIEPRNSDDRLAYTGEAPMGALVDRALEIERMELTGVYRSGYPAECPERTYAALLDVQIDRFYTADRENVKSSAIFTKILVLIRAIVWRVLNLNIAPFEDHQFKWRGGEGSCVGLNGHILIPLS